MTGSTFSAGSLFFRHGYCMSIIVTCLSQKGANRKVRLFLWILFVCYLGANLYFTTLPRTAGTGVHVDFVPIQSYHHLFRTPNAGEIVSVSGVAALVLKELLPIEGILLYYPLGYLLPILFPKLKPKHIILVGYLCSVATEVTQYILKLCWCETDDVIHNTLGTAIGVWVWLWQSQRMRKQKKQKEEHN